MKEFLLKLAAVLGLSLNEGDSDEQLQSSLCDAITSLKAKADTSCADLEKEKKISQSFLTNLRDRLARAAALTMSEIGCAPLITLAQRATPEELQVLVAEHERLAEEKYPMLCNDCKSKNVSRQSTAMTSGAEPPAPPSFSTETSTTVDEDAERILALRKKSANTK